jgi:hypothetical protein
MAHDERDLGVDRVDLPGPGDEARIPMAVLSDIDVSCGLGCPMVDGGDLDRRGYVKELGEASYPRRYGHD